MRSSITTFLITAVFASDGWILQSTHDKAASSLSLFVIFPLIIGPLALLLTALAISANFQRLTFACAIIQEEIERALGDDNQAIPYFRTALQRLVRPHNGQRPQARFIWIMSDAPQRALAALTMAQLLISFVYWIGKADLFPRFLSLLCR